MGLGPIVLDAAHRKQILEALRCFESGLKRGEELANCLDQIDDCAIRSDLMELLFRAQDILNLRKPDWLKAANLVRERMLDE